MIDESQATDATFDAEPTVPETPTAIIETPAQAPEKKKFGRGAKSPKAAKPAKATRARKVAKVEEVAPAPEVVGETVAKSAKAAKPAKATRARKIGKSEEVVAPAPEVVAKPVAKTARKGKLTSTVKAAKPATPTKAVTPVKVAKSAGTAKRAKAEKTAEAAKPAKVAKSPTKVAKAAPVAIGGRDKGERYTTNELSSATRKAGLTIEFTPVVMAPANIGRGPAKEFKVDAMVARLRGSNGGLINERGPGTTLYNDAESLAAVEIFEKFRGRTFHNKLKVEIS
jgi:hypothetical protein